MFTVVVVFNVVVVVVVLGALVVVSVGLFLVMEVVVGFVVLTGLVVVVVVLIGLVVVVVVVVEGVARRSSSCGWSRLTYFEQNAAAAGSPAKGASKPYMP